MENLKVLDHNVETGEIVLRDMTKEEVKQIELDNLKEIALQQETQQKKESALAKLAVIGLEVEDLKALGFAL
jgi:predicted GIY-YIG superfamily endonuclease